LRQNLRSGVMLAIACLASPCCTPLYVPILLLLLAGTPAALWIGQHSGWVYGGLTLLSGASFLLAVRWMRKPKPQPAPLLRPMDIPLVPSFTGDKAHVE
jgi:hypothetical protein